jgi:branched-chain amino acid transport system permease protein
LAYIPLVLVGLALVPSMSQFAATLAMSGMCLALFACAISLLLGQAGILSLGHAMLLAVGGYVAVMVLLRAGLAAELVATVLGRGGVTAAREMKQRKVV